VDGEVTRRTELDQAFHADPRWLGGDGAYTIDLGHDRTLWLFGDSFIATSDNLTRSESTMVRNSVAVMAGRDLTTATLDFAWRDGAPPTSFFPEQNDHWFWPTDGARVPGGPLVVFLSEIRGTPDQGLGFAGVGFRAVRVPDPSGPPLAWTIEPTAAHPPAFAPTASVACSTVDGDHLVALVTDDDSHDGYLARWPLAALADGDLADPTWWTGSEWRTESALSGSPAIVIPDGATECSLHRDPYAGQWLFIWSRGFGATTIAMRTAPALTGPWSRPVDIFTPPESNVPDAFVYAAKAHPMLPGPAGGIVITYADNSFTFGDLFDPAKAGTLYWPHVAALFTTALAY
jgi:hypothetical protein